jgi:ATP phosphoribosyltransferase regulatory subunit
LSDFGYDIPATGFAVNVDAVANVLRKTSEVTIQPADAIIYAAPRYEMKAVKVSQELREKGQVVEYAFFDEIELVREYARERRIGRVVIVDDEITEVR